MSVSPPPTRWTSPPPVYDHGLRPGTALHPYLELPHLLSLAWLAYPILSLLFILFRLSISSDSAQTAVINAKDDLLFACQAAQRAASSTASMPRYMAVATNEQIADAVNGTMNAARAALILALTVMETVINFIVDIYRSTFLCFLELIVRGALSILIGATQEISNLITSTFNGLRTSIQNDISSANSAIKTAIDAINKVNPFSDISVPQISVPSLDALQNVTLPTDFQDALLKLNASIPSVSDLKDKVNAILDTPFELLKKDINDTFIGISFNSSVLPVPDRSTLSFCDNMDTSVVDDLGRDLLKIAKIGIIIIAALALLLLAGNCALEWYKWRCLKRHLEYTRQAWMSDPTIVHESSATAQPTVQLSDHNLLMLQANSAHPFLTRLANQLSALLRLSPSQHIHVQWFLHYVFHPPALACFLIGFFGILSVQLQLFAIAPLEARYQSRASAAVSDFSGTIFTSLNESMYNQSSLYANDINGRINAVQTTINDGLFGWVNGTTTTLNDTLNVFYSDIQNAVATVFNGTILEQPAQEFIQCFIGSKVDALEDALTFLHNNLAINMPRVNASALVLSPAQIDEAAQPIAAAAIGGGDGDGDSAGLVGRLIGTYVQSLKKERVMFAVFLALWGLVAVMGLCVVLWHSCGTGAMEARSRRKWRRDQRSGFAGIVVPFKSRDVQSSEKRRARGGSSDGDGDGDGAQMDLPSFTPMPSPRPAGPPYNADNEPRHPNRLLGPKFQKSFDSFFDHAAPRDAPRVALAAAAAPDAGERTKPWFARFQRAKPAAPTQPAQPSSRASTPASRRPKPPLTISTAHAAQFRDADLPVVDADLPAIARTSPSDDAHPASAWSVSPGPAPAPAPRPWLHNLVRPTAPPAPPRRAQPAAGVPVDVGASAPDDIVAAIDGNGNGNGSRPPPAATHLAVPLHHTRGDRRPPPAPADSRSVQPHLQPQPQPQPRAQPAKTLRVVNASVPAAPPRARALLVPPGFTPHGQRRAPPAADPFVTPFDDEARVSSPEAGGAGGAGVGANYHRQYENPFAAIAI